MNVNSNALQDRVCPVAKRRSLIESILRQRTHPLQAQWVSINSGFPWIVLTYWLKNYAKTNPFHIFLDWKQKELCARRIKECCHFDSPVVQKINTVLDSTRHLCRILHQQAENAAQNRHESEGTGLQFQTYDADANYGAKRRRKIEENLEHYFRTDGASYQAIADKTQKLFGSSGGDLCGALVAPWTAGCLIIAGYEQNVTPLPRKVLADLRNFLKFAPLDAAEENGALLEEVERALDDLDYDRYLAWDGLWRKNRPAGQFYPKRSSFLSAVVSFLLNLKWHPVVPVKANFLSPVPLKVSLLLESQSAVRLILFERKFVVHWRDHVLVRTSHWSFDWLIDWVFG